jgi:tRNA-specific 2-thiouridylase
MFFYFCLSKFLTFLQNLSKSSASFLKKMTKKDDAKNPALEKIEALEAQLEEFETRAETAESGQKRALADLENFRRRETENRKNWSTLAVAEFLEKMLPNFLELSLGAEHSTDEDLKKVVAKFFENLKNLGVEKIAPTPRETRSIRSCTKYSWWRKVIREKSCNCSNPAGNLAEKRSCPQKSLRLPNRNFWKNGKKEKKEPEKTRTAHRGLGDSGRADRSADPTLFAVYVRMKIVVGISGGVDSAVAAKLLVDAGHDVIGVFMRNWEENSPDCTAPEDAVEAEKVCAKLGIPFEQVNFTREYWDHVFEYFLEENRAGRTPNPDILCNKFVKFDAFLTPREKVGCRKKSPLDTTRGSRKWRENLSCSSRSTREKDQTYFLHALDQEQLGSTLFPLAELKKSEIRKIARDAGFANAERKDSTGICFIGERNYFEFLEKFLKKTPGDIVTTAGEKVGEHAGLSFYTLGQRRNLHVGGVRNYAEAPWFVVRKDAEKNELVISQDESELLATKLRAKKMNWIAGAPPAEKFEAIGKIRYRDAGTACEVVVKNDEIAVKFTSPVRAITPGQSVVLYDKKTCLGGGEII